MGKKLKGMSKHVQNAVSARFDDSRVTANATKREEIPAYRAEGGGESSDQASMCEAYDWLDQRGGGRVYNSSGHRVAVVKDGKLYRPPNRHASRRANTHDIYLTTAERDGGQRVEVQRNLTVYREEDLL